MFENIPAELRELPQWVVWRLEYREGMPKPTKTPYIPRPNSGKASVIDPKTWGSFANAINAPLTSVEPVDPDAKVSETGFTGIGFVFSANDEYCGIDLDDCHGDTEIYNNQLRIFHEMNSYTEFSPSRTGVHIIVKGKVPTGRRRSFIELYPQARFFTMTGDVLKNAPIAERQVELNRLYAEFKSDVKQVFVQPDEEQKDDDAEIIERAKNAVNGEKFTDLWEGRWQKYYESQSEGDFALMDMLAFYTKYIPQIDRLFLQSMLGQRDKAKRADYRHYMIEKAFDRQLPPIDFDGLMAEIHQQFLNKAAAGVSTTEPGKGLAEEPSTAAATLPVAVAGEGRAIVSEERSAVNPFTSGLLGQVAQFLYEAAPRPAIDVAMAGAVAFLSGICGRAYNISNTGLNQYVLLLAQTGTGKEFVSSGTGKLIQAIQPSCPSIIDFKGPGEMASSQGLIKWLSEKPCVLSIVGEIGEKLKEMAAPNANSHLIGLFRALLQMYQKSGYGDVFDATAYSDRTKNTPPIYAPSLTLFGESVPESFYESLDDRMIGNGLLPRFLIWEYNGERSYLNQKSVEPSMELTQDLANVAAHCLTIMNRKTVQRVEMAPDVAIKHIEFDHWTTDLINQNSSNIYRHLWNRAHLKAIKLAALRAVGDNYINPIVNMEHFMWASDLVVGQTERLIAKFETGQVGSNASTGEMKQLADVIKTVREFLLDVNKYEKYGGRNDMCAKGVVTESSVVRKLAAASAFKHDRMGSTHAIKRAIKTLCDADDLREVPSKQMFEMFGTKPKAFCIANPKRFDINLFGKQN